MSTAPTTGKIWQAPAVLALTTVIGLISALLGDGPWDLLSWCALSVPVAVMIRVVSRWR